MGVILQCFSILGLSTATIVRITSVLMILIFAGGIAILAYKKSEEFNNKLLNTLVILISFIYVFDLFSPLMLHELGSGSIPFSVGTVMAPLIVVTRYIKPFDRIKPTVAVFSVISVFVYLLYPARVIATPETLVRLIFVFIYYGLVFAYGVALIISNEVRLRISKVYMEALGILIIEGYSMIVKSITISAGAMIPDAMPKIKNAMDVIHSSPIIIVLSFIMCLIVHLLYYLYSKYILKIDYNDQNLVNKK